MDTVTAARLYPKYLAYFTVAVRLSECQEGYGEQAASKVTNYLYRGATVVATELAEDMTHFLVLVAVETYVDGADLKYRVQYQRDRLSSGLYPSTEPVFYGPMTI